MWTGTINEVQSEMVVKDHNDNEVTRLQSDGFSEPQTKIREVMESEVKKELNESNNNLNDYVIQTMLALAVDKIEVERK